MADTSSTKPYLIRAIHEWCNDNGFTPYLSVAVDERTVVPREHVKGGEIVLNVSPMATNRLSLGNDLITFQARFGGVARELSIPVENVSAIYARENGHGMAFDVPKAMAVSEPATSAPAPSASVPSVSAPPAPASSAPRPVSGIPSLAPVLDAGAPGQRPGLAAATPSAAGEAADEPRDTPPDGTPPKGARPRLTRIK